MTSLHIMNLVNPEICIDCPGPSNNFLRRRIASIVLGKEYRPQQCQDGPLQGQIYKNEFTSDDLQLTFILSEPGKVCRRQVESGEIVAYEIVTPDTKQAPVYPGSPGEVA